MRKAKNEELLLIADQFEQDYQALCDDLDLDAESLEAKTKKISELQKLYKTVDGFPVWPFQASKIVRFSATVLSPIAIAVITNGLTMALSKYMN